jgi:AcrR family transcriptional regulator
MSPRPDVSEERKSQILEAATAVFARMGFQQSRMEDIASQAGLSKGALYLYYKSKDAVIAALLRSFFTQEFKHLQHFVEVERPEPVSQQILLLTRQLIDAMGWMEKLMPIAFEFYALAGRDKETQQFLQGYFRDFRAALASLIQRGIERGEFRAGSAETFAVTLTALYEGMALLSFTDPHGLAWPQQIENSVQSLLDGIRIER